MIQDYITYLTDDLKIAHTVLPFGADDFMQWRPVHFVLY